MNRRERRKLERQGQIVKTEPVYNMKPSEIAQAAVNIGKDAMNQEINRQILELDKRFTLSLDAMVLWALYSHYGFREKRLKDFYTILFTEHKRLTEYYEMGKDYPEIYKLKQKGIDVEQWYNEMVEGGIVHEIQICND